MLGDRAHAVRPLLPGKPTLHLVERPVPLFHRRPPAIPVIFPLPQIGPGLPALFRAPARVGRVNDAFAQVAELPGVASAVADARTAVDRLLGHRVLRRRSAEVSAESALRGARASAALEGAWVPLSDLRGGGTTDPIVQGALRVSAELGTLEDTWRVAPRQALARLHVLAAADTVPSSELGRPSSPPSGSSGSGSSGSGPSGSGPSGTGPSGTGLVGSGRSETGPSGTGPSGTGPSGNGSSGTGSSGTGSSGTGSSGTGSSGTGSVGSGLSASGSSGSGPSGSGRSGTEPLGSGWSGTGPLGTGPSGTEPLGAGLASASAPAPSPAEVAARLDGLSELLTGPSKAPALVVGAIVHAELLALRPFGSGDGIVARAAQRLTLVQRGLDPKSLTAPEIGHLALADDYSAALHAYLTGTPEGVAQWIAHCAKAVVLAAQDSQAICEAILRG